METITKYFDEESNECEVDKAVTVIVHEIDDNGKLINESIYHK